jgi:hypothetical protein
MESWQDMLGTGKGGYTAPPTFWRGARKLAGWEAVQGGEKLPGKEGLLCGCTSSSAGKGGPEDSKRIRP